LGASAAQALADWSPEQAARTVARIVLRGSASPPAVEECRAAWLERLAGCFFAEVRDETRPAPSEAELAAWQQEHPLLTEVLADLQALAQATGRLSPAERAELGERAGGAEFSPELLAAARRLLWHSFREAGASC
jgi:hypothetical protein